ncbi:MAG: META domain-containing protein [Nonlabens sp.]
MNVRLLILLWIPLLLASCEEKELKGSYIVEQVVDTPITGDGVTIIITKDDGYRISGNNSCNEYGADINYDGSNYISIGQTVSTRMYCEDTKDIERLYMSTLGKVAQYRFSQGKLTLLDKDGITIITARKTKTE